MPKGLFTFLPTHQYLFFSVPYTFTSSFFPTSSFFLSDIFYLLDMSHFRNVVLVVLAAFSVKLSPASRGRHGERATSNQTRAGAGKDRELQRNCMGNTPILTGSCALKRLEYIE